MGSIRIWDEERDQILRDLYPDYDSEDVAIILGVTREALNARAYLLKVKKSKKGLRAANRASWRKGGNKGVFKPGNKSWNAGTKGLMNVTEKSRATQFKPGHLPAQTMYDGAISIRIDKRGTPYKFIRIGLAKWIPLSVYEWEKHHGPVPKGSVVRFRSDDTMNCDIENLECVPKALNMLLNSKHKYDRDMAECQLVVGEIKKIIRKKRNEKHDAGSEESPLRNAGTAEGSRA